MPSSLRSCHQPPSLKAASLSLPPLMGLPPLSSTLSVSMTTQQWSKPRTIIRRLTTKFSTPIQVSRTPTNAFAKETRDAALRERGLLPPLRPNKDLSAQEQEQDRAIPILVPKDHKPHPDSPSPSAADQIKRDWEAKNRSESNQLRCFKFGGISSLPLVQISSSDSADSAILTQPLSPLPDVALSHSAPSNLGVVSPAVSITQPASRPVTPLLEIPPEIAAYLSLNPPSPTSPSSPNPASLPLPPSPSSLRTTSRSSSGAITPSPLDIPETSPAPTPIPPLIALTPCATDPAPSPVNKRSELSAPLDESASSQTPSLDSNSPTTTDSTLGTAESAAISFKGKLGGLRIKTHEGSNYHIPAIVESPIEDDFLEEQCLVQPTCNLAPMSAPINGSAPRFTLTAPRMNKRGLTDPTNGSLNRKKSMIMNPFKRGLSAGNEDQSSTPEPQRRLGLTIKTSFSNMRRSVVGTLSARSSPDRVGGGRISDASYLPSPSSNPTSPGSGAEERRAVSPILYSRGHILMEASHIKDEESRRVTEMAFLT